VFVDQIKIQVADDKGESDTVSFNLFVNYKNLPTSAKSTLLEKSVTSPAIATRSYSNYTTFSLPAKTGRLCIFDVRGRLVENVIIKDGSALWQGTNNSGIPVSEGRYFAKMRNNNATVCKPFVFVR
jgi:flagellar hook assembly protein FlgD